MNSRLWSFYLESLQGHPTPCVSPESTTKEQILGKVEKYFTQKGSNLLVLGSGDDKETSIFNDIGFNTIGLTLDKHQTSKERTVTDIDMHDLTKFKPELFSYVYCNQVFEHAFAPFILCLEVWTVLKPNGIWYVEIPAHEATGRSGLVDPLTKSVSHHHPNMIRTTDAMKLFHITGFKTIDIKPGGNDVFVLSKIPSEDLHKYRVHPDVIRTLNKRRALEW